MQLVAIGRKDFRKYSVQSIAIKSLFRNFRSAQESPDFLWWDEMLLLDILWAEIYKNSFFIGGDW